MKFPNIVVELCKLLDENKAQEIVVCDSTRMQNSVDFFIIATATSNAHIRGIVGNITETASQEFGTPLREGFGHCDWVVLSYESVFVHIFTKEERNRYNLEKLLNDGKNMISFKRLISILKQEEKREKANIKKASLKEQKEKKNEDRSQKQIEKKEKEQKQKKEKKDMKKKIKVEDDEKKVEKNKKSNKK